MLVVTPFFIGTLTTLLNVSSNKKRNREFTMTDTTIYILLIFKINMPQVGLLGAHLAVNHLI
jgi:hypothetical protein